MKKIIYTFFIAVIANISYAQYAPVNFDFERSWFNEGGTLPAEQYFIINSKISSATQLVEVTIYKSDPDKPLYFTNWTRSFGNTSQAFSMPVNFPLRGNSDYSFQISYFINATDYEKSEVSRILNERFGAYVDQMVEVNNKHIRLRDNYKVIMSDLNEIMNVSMRNYRSRTGFDFDGFSSIVENKIKQLEDLKLKRAFLFVGKSEDQEKVDAKSELLKMQLDAIKQLIVSEAAQYINVNLLSQFEKKEITDYPTEKTMRTLPVNIGYAGIYESGNFKNLSYGTAPFAGMSFPLGKKQFSSAFWSNTSLSFGVMLTKIKMSSDTEYTGAIFGVPLYAALGYKVLNVLRINAGFTFLQKENDNGADDNFNSIYLRPFLGASFEFNVWAGFSK